MKTLIVLISYTLILTFCATAGTIQGIRGPIYLTPGWHLKTGNFVINGFSRIYYKNEAIRNSNRLYSGVTLWDAHGTLNILYGIAKYYEIGLSQMLYKENYRSGEGYNLLDDLYLKFKVASFRHRTKPLNFGIQLSTRFPMAKSHNIYLEPYSVRKLKFSILSLVSYSKDLSNPDKYINAHANIGFLYHTEKSINLLSFKEIIYGFGLVYPINNFDFSLELYGNLHLSTPLETAYLRYNYVYITPGMNYCLSNWLSFMLAFDYRLSGAKIYDTSQIYSYKMPLFPKWRISFGIKLCLSLKPQKKDVQQEQQESVDNNKKVNKMVLEEIVKERKRMEVVELELKKVMEERKEMDIILERLRNILESKGDDKTNSERK